MAIQALGARLRGVGHPIDPDIQRVTGMECQDRDRADPWTSRFILGRDSMTTASTPLVKYSTVAKGTVNLVGLRAGRSEC